MKNIILTVLITVGLTAVTYKAGFERGTFMEKKKNMEVALVTFEPIKDCLAEVHFSNNGQDLGVHWAIWELPLPPDRDCGREIGTILHKYLYEN